MAYILAAGALSKLVVATDVPNTDAHDLTHFYEEKSEDHVAIAIRYVWIASSWQRCDLRYRDFRCIEC